MGKSTSTPQNSDDAFVTRADLQYFLERTMTFLQLASGEIIEQKAHIDGLSSVVTLMVELMRESGPHDLDRAAEAIRNAPVSPEAAQFALDLLGFNDGEPLTVQ